MRRTGHHAVINWMLGLWGDDAQFFNNLSLLSPWQKHRQTARRPGFLNTAIVNFEEYFPHVIPSQIAANSRYGAYEQLHLGRARRRRCILVLRDPYNTFASRLVWSVAPWNQTPEKLPLRIAMSPLHLDWAVELWKAHAREFLGELEHYPDALRVNYNRWFVDEEYRRELAEWLDVPFSDAGLQRVSRHGQGSSFDYLDLDGRGQDMNVLRRWEQLTGEHRGLARPLQRVVDDAEVRRLSDAVFGPIEVDLGVAAH
jgi:hypothetical protein